MALEEQMKAAIEVAAKVKAELEIAKLEQTILLRNYGEDNPIVKDAGLKVIELNNQLANLKFGEDKNLKSS